MEKLIDFLTENIGKIVGRMTQSILNPAKINKMLRLVYIKSKISYENEIINIKCCKFYLHFFTYSYIISE
ncbi:MAG: hypothetical protein RR036_04280 [Oscillospiraceae bacterium]